MGSGHAVGGVGGRRKLVGVGRWRAFRGEKGVGDDE